MDEQIEASLVAGDEAFRIWEWPNITPDKICKPQACAYLCNLTVQTLGKGQVKVYGSLWEGLNSFILLTDADGFGARIKDEGLLILREKIWKFKPIVEVGNVTIRIMEGKA